MRCFTVYWNNNDGETRISYADWFKPEADPGTHMVILDALNDAILELTELYHITSETKPIKDKA